MRYQIYPVASDELDDILDDPGELQGETDDLSDAHPIAMQTGGIYGMAIVDTLTRKIDFGYGFGVPVPSLG